MNLLELQRENEALKLENETLKLKLFWKEHGPGELNAAMRLANQVEAGPGCSCLACAVSGRHESEYGEIAENKPCTFKVWFEQMLREHEMSIGYGIPDVPIWVDGSVCDSGNNVLDDGHHFSNSARQDWFCWTYGSRLWKATSVCDPELAKLERLFKTLDMVGWEETEE
jgi:hypothetical protein